MILQNFIAAMDIAHENMFMFEQCLGEANSRLEHAIIRLSKIEKELADAENQLDKVSLITTPIAKALGWIWQEHPELESSIDSLYNKHYLESRKCTEYKERADALFKDGDVAASRIFRTKSLLAKNNCVDLQKQIASVEKDIECHLKKRLIDTSYKDYRKALSAKRRLDNEIPDLRIKKNLAVHEREEVEEILKLCKKQFNESKKSCDSAWRKYCKIAIIIADIPEEYRAQAKVSLQNGLNQTKIIFGESPDTDIHGHAQIDNRTEKIIYYRLPEEKHGSQNFTDALQS